MTFSIYLFQNNKKIKKGVGLWASRKTHVRNYFLKVICGKEKNPELMENKKPPRREKMWCAWEISTNEPSEQWSKASFLSNQRSPFSL